MSTYREQQEIELNVLQACSSEPILTSHIAMKCRLNMSYARLYVTRLTERGWLMNEGRYFKTSPKGFAHMKSCETVSQVFSGNYKKVMEAIAA